MSGSIPYIGSKVSLIATTDIRYEGILYTLNREESTIAVQNVRSFGTEGRRKPEVPMSNEVYDFIIFRGKDLKDLTVLQGAPEPPSIQAIPQYYQDSHTTKPADPLQDPRQAVGHNGYSQDPRRAAAHNGYDQNGYAHDSYASNGYSQDHYATNGYSQDPRRAAGHNGYDQNGYSQDPRRAAGHNGYSQDPPAVPMPPAPPMAPPQAEAREYASNSYSQDPRRDAGHNGYDQRAEKSIAPRKQIGEVLQLHKRAEESIGKAVKVQGAAALGAAELRAFSETNPAVYHFYLDFVNYCCAPHMVQSDEQQWETLCKALRKHFERDLCVFAAGAQSQKPPPPQVPQRPNNTLGDFMSLEAANGAGKKGARGRGAAAGRGTGRGTGRGESGKPSNSQPGPGLEPHSGASWVCPRCTLSNESLLVECAACDTPKQQAALWAEFPPLAMA